MNKSKYRKIIPEKLYQNDIVFMEYEDKLVPFKVVRKSPNSLVLKSKEEGVKRSFWSSKKYRYKVGEECLLLN